MMKFTACAAAAALLWLPLTGAASAQETDTIVVTGQTQDQVQRFVDNVSISVGPTDQLARWDNSICTSIVGLPRRQGQFFADRIAQRAYALGIQPGAPGCHGNVAVFVTDDADGMAQSMFEEDASLFAYYQEANISTMGQDAFRQNFLNSDRPVRWWHVAETFSADGIALRGDASSGGIQNAPAVRASGTRLRGETRQDFARVIIIVDANQVGGAQLASLADYVAMVALAQINPQADTSGFPTILNLFNGGDAATQLTDWDQAFLNSLYNTTRASANALQQRREIARRMQGG